MALIIWCITDGKAGHDSQSIGLCNAIKKLKDIECFNIIAEPALSNLLNLTLNRFPAGKTLPDPDLIIGAGHGSHLTMLSAKRTRGGKTVVLMKPSLPFSLFDICVVPEHDQVNNKKNVISTKGAINPVQFNEQKLNETGLILIGGPSKHYVWDDKSIYTQVKTITEEMPDIHWSIADSPRTPDKTLSLLSGLSNIEIFDYKNTDSQKLRETIYKSANIWVSEDSVSMIYESLSSGATVGLLHVAQKGNNRISDFIKKLINEKQLTPFSQWQICRHLSPPSNKFNEAERCATLLLEKGLLD